jgi:DNA primase
VEGYVDVIAMHMVGFGNTVAPLGTALTEEQMQLMWRMADEPILCFDGDKAGRKAAYRAIDVALPLLPPGKSVRFALLPEGQDPDDLARSGGREAIAGVLDQARPLIDMVWAREMEAGPTDTPERRASMERRLKEALQRIPDESTRRYYREEIENRMARAFPAAPRRAPNAGQGYQRSGTNGYGAGYGRQQGGRPGTRPEEPLRASPALARSRMYVAASKTESPREAFIVAGLAQRSELLEQFSDEIAELDLSGPAALKLAQALLDMIASGETTSEAVAVRLAAPGLQATLLRLDGVISSPDRKKLGADVDSLTLADAIHQAIVLHRRARTLHSELKSAERALAEDMTDANFVWVKDVKARLESVEGTQADRDLPE